MEQETHTKNTECESKKNPTQESKYLPLPNPIYMCMDTADRLEDMKSSETFLARLLKALNKGWLRTTLEKIASKAASKED